MSHVCRAKRSDTGGWVVGYVVELKVLGTRIFTGEVFGTPESYSVDPDTVCRCSGIPAIDKRMIFAGDKVELRHMAPNPGPWSRPPTSGVVVDEEGCWCVDTGSELIFLWQEIDQWEITGHDGGCPHG